MHRYGRKCDDLTLDSRPGRTNAVAILCCISDRLGGRRVRSSAASAIGWSGRHYATALHGRKPMYGDEIPRDHRGRFRKGELGGRPALWEKAPLGFLRDAVANCERHGEAALTHLRLTDPMRYFLLMVAIETGEFRVQRRRDKRARPS
jgi:hypothetical protein